MPVQWFYKKIKTVPLKIAAAVLWWEALRYFYRWTPIGTFIWDAPFYGPLPFIQIVSIGGFFVLSGFILALNCSLSIFLKEKSGRALLFAVCFVIGLAGIYAYGEKNLLGPSASSDKTSIALIQHNLPMDGLWRLDHADEIRARYKNLALDAAQSKPQLIIFPQYTFPDDILRNPEFFLSLAKETGAFILTASHIPKIPGGSMFDGYSNVAVLYSPEGKIAGRYEAVQAAPFNRGQVSILPDHSPLDSPFGRLGILLCYEDLNPAIAQKTADLGAAILISLSNPGHFVSTNMPYYHLFQDQLRALETRLKLLRVSPNGFSAEIDEKGRVLKQSRLGKQEIFMIHV